MDRGEIWHVDLDPTKGTNDEASGTIANGVVPSRPVVAHNTTSVDGPDPSTPRKGKLHRT
jgi:hypothetical protein